MNEEGEAPGSRSACEAAYARDLVRRRALSIATTYLYFPVRGALLKALAARELTIGDLTTLSDRELLERAGVTLDELHEPAGTLEV